MYEWLNYMKEASFMMLLGVILILVVKKMIGKHMTTSWNYYIWLLVLLQLAVPAGFSIDAEYNLSSFVIYAERHFEGEPVDNQFYVEDMDESESESFAGMGSNEESILFYIWIMGAAALSSYLLMGRIGLKKREYAEAEVSILHGCFDRAVEMTGCKRKIGIYSSSRISCPVVCGSLRPVIICPDNMLNDYSEKEIVYMLAHELTHIKCFHNLMQALYLLSSVIFWFNPFSWVLFKRMKNDAEIMCDTIVSKNMDEYHKIEYGKLLLTAAGKRRQWRLEPVLALSQKGKLLNHRIESLFSHERSKAIRVASILVFILLFIFMTTGAGSMMNISREEALVKIHDANKSSIVSNVDFYDYTYCIEGLAYIEEDVYRIKYLFDGDRLADVKYYSINGSTSQIDKFRELYLSWI